jgi:hypothetical protein
MEGKYKKRRGYLIDIKLGVQDFWIIIKIWLLNLFYFSHVQLSVFYIINFYFYFSLFIHWFGAGVKYWTGPLLFHLNSLSLSYLIIWLWFAIFYASWFGQHICCRTTISHFDFVKRDLCRPFGLISELPAATFTIQFANELLLFFHSN